jgi:hypothetical protein
MSQEPNVATWPQLAEGLYSFLTARKAGIRYEFNELFVDVPKDTTPNSPSARWRLHGAVTITTFEQDK